MKRNTPFPAGLAIVQKFLRECPEFGEIAASGGLTAVQVLLKAAPAKPSKSKALPHLSVGTLKALNADHYGLLEAGQTKVAEPMFSITVKEDVWAKLTPRGREAWIYTQLCRCVVTAKDDADSDDTGFTCTVIDYPVQTFDRVIEKYGRWDQTDVIYSDPEDAADSDSDDSRGDKKRTADELGDDALASGSGSDNEEAV